MNVAAPHRWVILGLAFISQFAGTLAGQVVPPLAPLLQSELELTKVEIGLFSSAAFMGSWGILLIAGYLTERFGVRTIMTLGLMLAGGMMLAMSLSTSFLDAGLIMFAVGAFRGLVHPGASKAIMDWFPLRERATAMGVKQTGFPVAGILLASTLPAVAMSYGWRIAIALVGVIIIAGGLTTVCLYRDPPGGPSRSHRQVSMRHGLRELIGNQRIWALSGIGLLFSAAQMGMVAYLALYFSDFVLVHFLPEQGPRIIASGAFLALLQAGGIVGRLFWGMVSDRAFPQRRLPVMAIIGFLAGLTALGFAFLSAGSELWILAVVVFVSGSSVLGWPGLYHALIVEAAGPGKSAMAVGLSMTLTQAGVIGGAPLFGLIVDQTSSYQVGWICLGCLPILGAIMAVFFSRRGDRLDQNKATGSAQTTTVELQSNWRPE